MEYRDYYATLDVPRGASQADIKKAYRKLARKYHPDVAKSDPNAADGGSNAEKRFKEINEANAVLGDPEKRKLYDQLGADWEAYARAGAAGSPGAGRGAGAGAAGGFQGFAGGAGGGAGGFAGFPGGVRFEYHGDPEDLAGFSDFFRTFFAGGAEAPRAGGSASGTRTSGTRVRMGRAGSIDDLLGGFGFGTVDMDELDDSGGFAGAGFGAAGGRTGTAAGRAGRADTRRLPSYEATAEITLEEAFHGATRIVEIEGRRLEVKIPRGIDTGKRVRMAGAGPGGADVHVVIRVAPHPVFARKGHDLHRELPITLAEALLGAEVPVGTLKGRVLLKVPPGTQPGRTFRLAGQGMPHMSGNGVGDLYVKIRVVLPDHLDDEAKGLVRELADHIKQPDPRRTDGRG
jgi:DnaJ-class molecular chaperone